MNPARTCSGCGASIDPAAVRCPYCGQWRQAPSGGDQGRWIAAWTQGIAGEGYSNGSYDVQAYPAMPLSQALQILGALPIPPRVPDPGSYCPPALGFGERNISRMEDGGYFLWPEDRACSFEEAKKVLLQIYGQADSPPR